MSIIDMLRQHEASERLVKFKPTFDPGETEQRRIFLVKPLAEWIERRTGTRSDIDLLAATRAQLAQFVKGRRVDNENFMKLLKPYRNEIWEIRILFKPQTRIFGMFALADCFICTNAQGREKLGEGSSDEWSKAEKKAEDTWDALFPGFRRWTGTAFEHYVTANRFDCRS